MFKPSFVQAAFYAPPSITTIFEPDKEGRISLAYKCLKEIPRRIVRERHISSLKYLDLSHNEIAVLDGLAPYYALETLVVDHNKIGSNCKFPYLPQLACLQVNSNLVTNLSRFLEVLAQSCPKLRAFSLLNNAACPNFFNGGSLDEYRRYRLMVLAALPTLTVIDDTPVTEDSRSEAWQFLPGWQARFTAFAATEEPAGSVAVSPDVPTEAPCRASAGGPARSRPETQAETNASRLQRWKESASAAIPRLPPPNRLQERLRGPSFAQEVEAPSIAAAMGLSRSTSSANGNGARPPSMVKAANVREILPEEDPDDDFALTVVLDLDETLIYTREGPLYGRPYLDELLRFLHQNRCEIVVWTAGLRDYAQAVVRNIDPYNNISHCIYRHTKWFKPNAQTGYFKNLDLMGRDLERVIIIENTPECVRGHVDNGVLVADYKGSGANDTTLAVIIHLVRDLLGSGMGVPEFLRSYPLLSQCNIPTEGGDLVVRCLDPNKASEDRFNPDLPPRPSRRPASPERAIPSGLLSRFRRVQH